MAGAWRGVRRPRAAHGGGDRARPAGPAGPAAPARWRRPTGAGGVRRRRAAHGRRRRAARRGRAAGVARPHPTFPVSPPTWTADVRVAGTAVAGTAAELRPPLTVAVHPACGRGRPHRHGGACTRDRRSPSSCWGRPGAAAWSSGACRARGRARVHGDTGGTARPRSPTVDGRDHRRPARARRTRAVTASSRRCSAAGAWSPAFDVGFAFAPDTGLRFDGSGRIEIQLPVHVEIGPVEVPAMLPRRAGVKGDAVPLELSAALAASLGVLEASVDRLGVIATLGFPAGRRQPRSRPARLRVQAAERRRPRRRRRRGQGRRLPASSTPSAASTRARSS